MNSPVDPRAADSLRVDLAHWTVDAVADVLGERAVTALDREQVIPARLEAQSAGADPVAVLTRLFMLGDQLPRAQVQAALPSLGVDAAARAGLVTAAGAQPADAVRAAIDLRPYTAADGDDETTWWIASDLGEAVTGTGVRSDHVPGIGGASQTLASMTVRRPVQRSLDLGTGCGIQALHASAHSAAVIATDISPRALGFAAFNDALNRPEQSTWDLRRGNLLEPVAGEQFDLLVTNPPFVISPPGLASFDYRDAGLDGDDVMAALIRAAHTVLAPGGIAQMLGNWLITDTWTEALETWLADSPLDAWVVQRDVLDVAHYAETWMRDAGITADRDPRRWQETYQAYLHHFDALGVEAVGFGMITLRRSEPASATMRRFEELSGPVTNPLGAHLARALDAHDWLSGASLLDARLTVAPDVTKETYGRPLLADPEHILMRQGGGFGRAVRADTAVAGFVGACDGELTVGQIAHALAALLDVPVGEFLQGLLPAVGDLVRDGFLDY